MGHSYTTGANRALPRAMSQISQGRWEVECLTPNYFAARGDLRSVTFAQETEDQLPVHAIRAYNTWEVHSFTYGLKLRGILKQDWDLVHAWEEPYVFAGAQIAHWTPSSTRLVFRTAQSLNKSYPPPWRWCERYAMSRAAGWICSGKTVEENLTPRSGYQIPFRRIPLGVDTEKFQPNPAARAAVLAELGWSDTGAPIIGFLGRFVAEKGLQLLMDALDTVRTPWRMLFVGAGNMEPKLREWAARYPEQVRILNNVKHAEVPKYLQAFDMMVCPSQTTTFWREQFGRMIVESFAAGVPVIGSDSGEIPNVIETTGAIVAEADVSRWAATLGEWLDSPALRSRYAREGLARARGEFDWSRIAAEHIDFFEELLDTPQRQTDSSPMRLVA
ncbi:MAG: glycosyltransferase family 4 protein [Fimbriiglobus sp.]